MSMDRTVYFLLVCNVISNSAYGMIAPFLPQKLQGKDVEESMIGMIFSSYSAAVIVMSLFVGKIFDRIGPVYTLGYGLFQMGCAIILFGFIEIMEGAAFISTYSILVRLLQGCSSALIQTSAYIIIVKFYPSQQTKLVGYIEATNGLGILAGPLIGAALYSGLEFAKTFYVYGSCFLVFAMMACYFVNVKPVEVVEDFQRVNDDQEQSLTTSQEVEQPNAAYVPGDEIIPVGYCQMLSLRFFTLAASSCLASQIQYGFMEPILAPRLLEFNLSQSQVGLFFAILPVFYIFASVLVANIPTYVNKHATMIVGCWTMGIGCFFVGPSELFHLPQTLLVMAVGQAFCGIFYPLCLIPSLPAMIEEANKWYPGQDSHVKSTVSGMFNSIIGLGMFTGPLMGASLTEKYGFQLCADIMGFIFIAQGIIYFVIGNGFNNFRYCFGKPKRSRRQQRTDADVASQKEELLMKHDKVAQSNISIQQ